MDVTPISLENVMPVNAHCSVNYTIALSSGSRLICSKGAGSFHDVRKTMEELSANGTSRHAKVLKSGPNHGCQWIFKLKKSRRHKNAPMAQKWP